MSELVASGPEAAKQQTLLLVPSPVSGSGAAGQNRKRKCWGGGGRGRRYALPEVPPFSSVVRPGDRDQGARGAALNLPCPGGLLTRMCQAISALALGHQ